MDNLPIDKNQPVDNNQNVTNDNPPVTLPETPLIPTAEIPPEKKPETTPPSPEEQPKPEEQPIEIGSLEQPAFTSYTQGATDDDSGAKKGKKIKTIASVLGILLIIISLPLTVILVKQRQEIRKEAKISTTVSTSAIQNTPIGETLPTTANGGTYSTTFRVTNTASGSRTVVLQKMVCACPEGEGNPPGFCSNCSTSNETVTLSSGQSIERTLSAHQPRGTVCGSYQVDLTVVSVK